MNIHMKDIGQAWDEEHVKKVLRLIDAYDARGHVYFMSSCGALQDQLARLAPDIPRCMGYAPGKDIVDEAIKHKCQMVQLFKPYFDQSTVDRAHAAGLRVNVFWSDDPAEAKKFLDMGIDTILTNDYLLIANATGLR
jgi:glycerophosphoryl diester phosphodiesterase